MASCKDYVHVEVCEERLYSVKNRKTGIVFLVYANSYPDAIRRVKKNV